MRQFGLSKSEKLCSETAISMLFSGGRAGADVAEGCRSTIAYPLRAVWRVNNGRRDGVTDNRFLISIPKKRLRHAVDRVTMRRRCREAYRLNRHNFHQIKDHSLDIAFIYVADRMLPYATVENAIVKILGRIASPESVKEPPAGIKECE